LWFPEPGKGGDIPSRAEFAMTKEQFDAAFPEEFWREVVNRVANEAPDTLLLAEAFWMMEGYFVRSLGMHRVYNSAFMNMLRDEKNQEYRLVIKNTLQFEPEILKRYVNFMNNPDEKTAVEQFGKGDKYFGILVMMVTNPGLPMIGHGQVEGFTEKYGMEYRRAYYDETPDEWLVKRHEREIFPLMRKRYLFAEVKDFLLYDFYTPEGFVNEDVYVYSNRSGEERALVVVHNKYAETRGWIRISTPYPIKGENDERIFKQKSLGEGLELRNEPNTYVIFQDQISGLEYLRNSQELYNVGFYTELKAYEYHVFLNFREVLDDETHQYAHLAKYLQGGGVANMQESLREFSLMALLTPYRELVNSGWYQWVISKRLQVTSLKAEGSKTTAELSNLELLEEPVLPPFSQELIEIEPVLEECEIKALKVYQEIYSMSEGDGDPEGTARQTRQDLAISLTLPALQDWFGALSKSAKLDKALAYLQSGPGGNSPLNDGDPAIWGSLLSWICNRRLSQAAFEDDTPEQARSWMDEWLLGKINLRALTGLGVDEWKATRCVELVKLLVGHQAWFEGKDSKPVTPDQALQAWLKDSAVQRFIDANRFQGVLWFNKESFDELLWWMYAVAVLRVMNVLLEEPGEIEKIAQIVQACYAVILKLQAAEEKSEFQVEKLLEATKK
jgi:hypothetical protein